MKVQKYFEDTKTYTCPRCGDVFSIHFCYKVFGKQGVYCTKCGKYFKGVGK